MAEKQYFPHDYGARAKLADMRIDFGLEGVGFYWCLVEYLHEEGGSIKESRIKGIAYELRIDPEKADAIIHNYGLFVIKKGKITSDRVTENLKKRAEISAARRGAASSRWDRRGGKPEGDQNGELQKPEKKVSGTDGKEPASEMRLYIHDADDESSDEYLSKAEWHKRWIKDRIEKMPDELDGLDEINSSYLWDVQSYIENLMQMLPDNQPLTINGAKVDTGDFWDAVSYFFRNNETLRELWEAIQSVEQKCFRGEVHNKQNYMISTLYNTAKMSGA